MRRDEREGRQCKGPSVRKGSERGKRGRTERKDREVNQRGETSEERPARRVGERERLRQSRKKEKNWGETDGIRIVESYGQRRETR